MVFQKMVTYTHAKENTKFILTEKGKQDKRISVKFLENRGSNSIQANQKAVPTSWIIKGLVEEVDR